jgi:serine/threonine-protein kinase
LSLAAGSRLGPYEIVSPLGAGGMGAVYRARDTRLGRDVALKVLPEDLAQSPERRARFEREARLLATLNHSGIAGIHDVLEDAGTPILVMELIEGETLDERLGRGPLPLRQALEVGRQMAEALEAAHERGVIHRDLKPANVMLTPEGKAKLLDFGLAKALETGSGETKGEISSSVDTLTSPAKATGMGAVLGTAPYMSPEQARGEGVDKRTDVWAFGCVLFEMLTGRRAFPGATRTEAMAAVLDREPDWSALPLGVPPTVQALLRRCLQKEKGERLRDIGDARIELKEALEEMSSGTSAVAGAAATSGARLVAPPHAWLPWIGGLLVVGLVAGLGGWVVWSRLAVPSTPAARFTFSPPGDIKLLTESASFQHLAVAPDGRRVAFLGRSARGIAVYLREVGEIEAKVVPGTDSAYTPFFSPDGRWLGFAQGSRLMKIPLEGGAPVATCDLPGEAGSPGRALSVRGASWGPDGMVVFTPGPYSGLWRVPAEGGTPRSLTTLGPQKGETSHRWPQVLPGGRAALFTISPPSGQAHDARIGVVSLETGQYRVVLEGTGFARYLSSGHILYAKLGSVLAVPFDSKRLVVTGPPVTVLDDVQMSLGGHFYADLDVSTSGALVFVPGAPRLVERSLFWVDREGRAEPLTSARRSWDNPRLSPDGRRLALAVDSDLENTDVWLLDLERDASDRLASGGRNSWPVWSPDGGRVAFVALTGSGFQVTTVTADGSRPPEPVGERTHGPYELDDWSRDGRLLVFTQQNPGRLWDIGLQPLDAGREPRFLLANTFTECCAALSPDGRWMAYVSLETGSYEVYVQPFPALGEKHRVSTHGGIQPRWSRDGRELFYRSTGDRPKIMAVAVEVEVQSGLRLGRPKALFDDVFAVVGGSYDRANYDVAPDGRFVFIEKPPETPAPRQLVLIPDFAREMKKKLQAAGH